MNTIYGGHTRKTRLRGIPVALEGRAEGKTPGLLLCSSLRPLNQSWGYCDVGGMLEACSNKQTHKQTLSLLTRSGVFDIQGSKKPTMIDGARASLGEDKWYLSRPKPLAWTFQPLKTHTQTSQQSGEWKTKERVRDRKNSLKPVTKEINAYNNEWKPRKSAHWDRSGWLIMLNILMFSIHQMLRLNVSYWWFTQTNCAVRLICSEASIAISMPCLQIQIEAFQGQE